MDWRIPSTMKPEIEVVKRTYAKLRNLKEGGLVWLVDDSTKRY